MIPPFKWLCTFMDTCEEWHAFVEGFSEVLCPWPARYQPSDELLNDLKGDHHYYVFGRALGVLAWLIIAIIIFVIWILTLGFLRRRHHA